MSYFGFSPTQQNKALAYAAEHPIGTGTLQDAAFFDGAGTAVFEGLWSGVRQADQVGWAALDTVMSPVAEAVSETFGVRDSSADFFKAQRKLAEKSVRELTPDPGTTGTAGQVLFSLAGANRRTGDRRLPHRWALGRCCNRGHAARVLRLRKVASRRRRLRDSR